MKKLICRLITNEPNRYFLPIKEVSMGSLGYIHKLDGDIPLVVLQDTEGSIYLGLDCTEFEIFTDSQDVQDHDILEFNKYIIYIKDIEEAKWSIRHNKYI
jgi:hypothetical protein